MKKYQYRLFAALFVLMFLIVGCSSKEDGTSEVNGGSQENNAGGELRIALNAQPPTLDQHLASGTSTRDTGRLIFETLVTTNSKYEVIPMLAESVDISDDGKIYTFNLRQGVKFHNDKEMIAEDVVASMHRWLDKSPVTGSIFEGAKFEAIDNHTVVLELAKPSALVMDTLASPKQAAAIMPKEIIEAETEDGLQEYIGTGPFEFVEWKQDQYIHFKKYEDYSSVDFESDGLAGEKVALVDDIYFDIVTDPSTRIAGLQTGRYDIVYQIAYDDYENVDSDPNLQIMLDSGGELIYLYNKEAGPAADFKMREAINAALNIDEILLAAFTREELYSFSPGYMSQDIVNWSSNAGEEFYNQKDIEKAKKILEEIGYNGEEFKILVTRDYPAYYQAGVVIQEQLTKAGMNIKLDVFDWATFNEMINDSDSWDSLVVGVSSVNTPIQLVQINPTFAGGVGDQAIIDLLEEIETSPDEEEAKRLWDELQSYAWEEHLPLSQLGCYYNLFGVSNNVEGFTTSSGPVLWNTRVTN
ncbi:ABC transporter substrate-binding protein [Ornithinibacillus sp. 4-3]|uniref:ABC transporter substrate-binding protein n=1 Tax=Ornithinibacillus sp. 4-3 TaxID=3231488 RepID=A0AB39HLK1_9BACI